MKTKIAISAMILMIMTGCAVNDPMVPENAADTLANDKLRVSKETTSEFEAGIGLESGETIKASEGEGSIDKLEGEISLTDSKPPVLSEANMIKATGDKNKPESLKVSGFFYKIGFGYNLYQVSADEAEQAKKVEQLVNFFKTADIGEAEIIIEGNADQRGADQFNYALGIKRAKFVKDQILINTPILESKIKTISYGETNPLCVEETEGCYELNRRAEVSLKQEQ